MPASETITIKRAVLNELIRSGQQLLDAAGSKGAEFTRLEGAIRAAKSERARANSATAKANRRARAGVEGR